MVETSIGRTFDVEAAAEYLGVSTTSIHRWALSGELVGYRDRLAQGSPWRFTKINLDKFRVGRQDWNSGADGTTAEPA